MKDYIVTDEWKIIERGFQPEMNRVSESLFSLGNGQMGHRGNFEETYSGDSLQGSYIAGVYYPDKTRVGWWKNGYPEYFAKVLNAANWIGIRVEVDGEEFDLAHCEVIDFERVLDMKEGLLTRSVTARMASGKEVRVEARRFCSMAQPEIGAIRYRLTPLNFDGTITLTPYLDAGVTNEDANWDETFWKAISQEVVHNEGYLVAETKKTGFQVATGMKISASIEGGDPPLKAYCIKKDNFVSIAIEDQITQDQCFTLDKIAVNISSLNVEPSQLMEKARQHLGKAWEAGYDALFEAHRQVWASNWEHSDIRIEGDVAAQQGIRFNIFHLNQTYTGSDERLNIGPKGFTGEKYGGSTYWDTEAYCLPFYLSTADQHVARQLLVYRYRHLQKAIENASLLGFENGAALYPMVTMNGEECHNEWEITFEEIHRNGAIAYAIYDYVRYTGDEAYLMEYGLEVLIAIARFWAQRVNYSEAKQQYVILGVTGPNEYENNVNNNWYTNLLAIWCMQYTMEVIRSVSHSNPEAWQSLCERIGFYEYTEMNHWKDVCSKMYLPEDPSRQVFLQQEGFLDKVIRPASELAEDERPLNQKWSWDRILRSCYIKQADVLQGLYFFEEDYDEEVIRRNFDFYEPLTVHESSLSPCVHSILASRLGYRDKAYEMYLRTARLDLNDYNNDTEDGLHITSMAGTWMAVVKGFGGLRVHDGTLSISPFLPQEWSRFAFKCRFRGALLEVVTDTNGTTIRHLGGQPAALMLHGEMRTLSAGQEFRK